MYKAKALHASRFQAVDSLRAREQASPNGTVCYQKFVTVHASFLLPASGIKPTDVGLRLAERRWGDMTQTNTLSQLQSQLEGESYVWQSSTNVRG